MRIYLERLYNMQDRLDRLITTNANVDLGSRAVYQKRVVALQVELGELANELRFFKFWSKNQEKSDRTLAEYVDVLHFLLSIVNTLDARELEFNYPNDPDNIKEISMTEMFSLTMRFAGDLYEKPIMVGYAFMAFLDLGFLIGFTWDEIVAEYEKKHAENILRQASGY